MIGNFFYSSTGAAAGYQIDNSLRFRGAQYLSRTPSTNGDRAKGTVSMWFKKSYIQNGLANQLSLLGFTQGNAPGLIRYRYQYDYIEHNAGVNGTSSFGMDLVAEHRDPSAWMHFVWTFDYDNPSLSQRMRMYINGVRQTTSTYNPPTGASGNTGTWNASGVLHQIGRQAPGEFQGYMAEIHNIDGTALEPTSFGEYDENGVWRPIEVSGLTYGTNGFYLDFSDPSNIGADRSGNGNNWTATGFELTTSTSTSYDWMEDSPTNNAPTLNRLKEGTLITLSNANLTFASSIGKGLMPATFGAQGSSGKYYVEFICTDAGQDMSFGLTDYLRTPTTSHPTSVLGLNPWSWALYMYPLNSVIYKRTNSVSTATNTAKVVTGDVIGIAYDINTGEMWASKNNVWMDSGNPAAGTNPLFNNLEGSIAPAVSPPGGGVATTNSINIGQQPFRYTPPSGFEPLSTANLPAPDISNPSEHFQTLIGPGEGTGSTTPIGIQYKTTGSADSPSATYQDQVYGKPATDLGGADGVHPMFEWASRLILGGHDDWYIPAKNELEIIYRNLKPDTTANNTSSGANANAVPSATGNYTSSVPAQTSVSAFQSGGSEAFSVSPTIYWSATEDSGTTLAAARQLFWSGAQGISNKSSSADHYARAIRRVAYTGSEPAIGAAYEGGYFGGLIDAKATPNGTATHALIVAPKEGGEYGVATGILDVAQRTFSNGLWWVKNRANANQHQLVDSVRGGNEALLCPTYSIPTAYVASAGNSVAWCWATTNAATSNTDGDMTSTVTTNPDAGFSIVEWSATSNYNRVGHGLGDAPDFIIAHSLSTNSANGFITYHSATGRNADLSIADTNPAGTRANRWGTSAPTNTTFGVDVVGAANNQSSMIAYCWRAIPGYSSFGSYFGNGNTDGPFVYTGFRPAWVMIKHYVGSLAYQQNGGWYIFDNERNTYNPVINPLQAQLADQEGTLNPGIDTLSNGFKVRNFGDGLNKNSSCGYIYIAFAEHPVGGSGVSPATAR